jgi:hypothetical protein
VEIATIAAAAENASMKDQVKIAKLSKWMKVLHTYLLHSGEWDRPDLFVFRMLVADIYSNWCETTGQKAFPKLHMLQHCAEFAERWGILGAASESQIESMHAAFKALYHVQHRNMSHKPPERIRRSLADVVVAAVGPLVEAEIPEAASSLLSLAVRKSARNTMYGG